MALTKRRLQFLNQLMDLYKRTSLPIHYETLAKALGVSKWTAYDMLKEIEKLGFISRSYEVNEKETGRSQVVFSPTAKAVDLLKQTRGGTVDPAVWDKTVGDIKQMLNSMKKSSINELIRKLLDEIPGKQNSIELCGYIVGLLLVYLKKIGGKTEAFIRLVVQKTADKEPGILTFVCTVLGTIVNTVDDELGNEVLQFVSGWLEMLGDLSQEEQKMLSDFLNEALA